MYYYRWRLYDCSFLPNKALMITKDIGGKFCYHHIKLECTDRWLTLFILILHSLLRLAVQMFAWVWNTWDKCLSKSQHEYLFSFLNEVFSEILNISKWNSSSKSCFNPSRKLLYCKFDWYSKSNQSRRWFRGNLNLLHSRDSAEEELKLR